MTELTKILGKSWQCWFSKLLKKILGKGYKKLKKNLRSQFSYVKLIVLKHKTVQETQTQMTTSLYAKLVPNNNNNNTHLTALFQDYPGQPVSER